MKHLLFLLLLMCALSTDSAEIDAFRIQLIADGVYAAIPNAKYLGNCNAAIILLDNGVLVVDTEATPLAAQALIAQIKGLTDKPVKYVVNTHFHYDHIHGNDSYRRSWPGAEIVASEATRNNMERLAIPRLKHDLIELSRSVERSKNELPGISDATERDRIREQLVEREKYLGEITGLNVVAPTLTFDRQLILHRLKGEVQILWLGRGHTDGDVWVYLPKERVLVSGDSVHGMTPFMGDSYPYEWIQTLETAERLDFGVVIGGHGDVMRGKDKFELWKSYFRDLLDQTAAAVAEGVTSEDAKRRVSKFLIARYADKFSAELPEAVGDHVAKAYEVIAFNAN